MPSAFGFRLLEGKGGASGHLRTGEETLQVQCRGLLPGESYSLHRGRTFLESRRANAQGTLSFTAAGDGFFFLCDQKMRPVLWEQGADGPAGYFRAVALLPKPAADKHETAKAAEETMAITPDGTGNPSPANGRNVDALPQAAQLHATNAGGFSDEAVHLDTEEAVSTETVGDGSPVPPIAAAETVCQAQESSTRYRLHLGRYRIPHAAMHPAAAPLLRTPSTGPMACALPVLPWPDSLMHIQSALRCGQPFSNLGHPGFRCVKLPSPNPAFPYCVVGYQTRASRIAALLYALPGHPMMPPRGFADCRFQQNHWLRVQTLK